MFAAVPLLALPVLAYNIVVLTLAGGFGSQEATIRMTEPLFTIAMNSAAEWPVTLGDLLLLAGLIVLFIELLKSTTSRSVPPGARLSTTCITRNVRLTTPSPSMAQLARRPAWRPRHGGSRP